MDTQLTTISKDKIVEYLDSVGLGQSLTANEKVQFFNVCLAYNLNPIKKEIYASKFGNEFSIMVGYEVYIKRAERSGKLDGYEVKTEGNANDGSLKSIVTIYRKDWSRPFVHEVYYTEYVQRKKDGEINKFWRTKPITMIKKVAMSQGFRLCFPDENGGLPYSEEEINVRDVENENDRVHAVIMPAEKPSMNDKQFNTLVERIKNGEDVLEKAKSMFTFTKEQESALAAISTDFLLQKIKTSQDEKDLLAIREDIAELAEVVDPFKDGLSLVELFNKKCIELDANDYTL